MAVAAAFRLPRLGQPPSMVQDEGYGIPTAVKLLEGKPALDLSHPLTSRVMHLAGMLLFGPDLWAARFFSAVAGILLAPACFLMARAALASDRAALLTASLWLADNLYLVFSRLATTNVFAALFQVTAAALLLEAGRKAELSFRTTAAAGLAAGFALSTRWTSIPILGFLLLVFAFCRGRRLATRREALLSVATLLVLPAVVYFFSYLPWLAQGNSIADVVRLQATILSKHNFGTGTEPYTSRWYTWPLLYRPPLFYYEQAPGEGGPVRIVLAMGNPMLWWMTVPATVTALVLGIQRRDRTLLFAALGFGSAYLPWALVPRPVQYSHYYFEALPFACLSLGALIDRGWSSGLGGLLRAYVAVSVLTFLFFVPVCTALPIPSSWFYARLVGWVYPWRWLPAWYSP